MSDPTQPRGRLLDEPFDRETALGVARVVLKYAHDDDEARTLLAMLVAPMRQWYVCPTCKRHYETLEDYERQCGKHWRQSVLDPPTTTRNYWG